MKRALELAVELEKELYNYSEAEDCSEGLMALMKERNLTSGKETTITDYLNTLGVYLHDYEVLREENEKLITRIEDLGDRVRELEDQLDE